MCVDVNKVTHFCLVLPKLFNLTHVHRKCVWKTILSAWLNYMWHISFLRCNKSLLVQECCTLLFCMFTLWNVSEKPSKVLGSMVPFRWEKQHHNSNANIWASSSVSSFFFLGKNTGKRNSTHLNKLEQKWMHFSCLETQQIFFFFKIRKFKKTEIYFFFNITKVRIEF